MTNLKYLTPLFLVYCSLITSCRKAKDTESLSIVSGIDLTRHNDFYFGNRTPLAASRLINLAVGAVKAQGWLLEYLNRHHTQPRTIGGKEHGLMLFVGQGVEQ